MTLTPVIFTCVEFQPFEIGTAIEQDLLIGSNMGDIAILSDSSYFIVKHQAHDKMINFFRIVELFAEKYYLFTGGEDQVLKIWDKRFDVLKVVRLHVLDVCRAYLDVDKNISAASFDIFCYKLPESVQGGANIEVRILLGTRAGIVLEGSFNTHIDALERKNATQSKLSIGSLTSSEEDSSENSSNDSEDEENDEDEDSDDDKSSSQKKKEDPSNKNKHPDKAENKQDGGEESKVEEINLQFAILHEGSGNINRFDPQQRYKKAIGVGFSDGTVYLYSIKFQEQEIPKIAVQHFAVLNQGAEEPTRVLLLEFDHTFSCLAVSYDCRRHTQEVAETSIVVIYKCIYDDLQALLDESDRDDSKLYSQSDFFKCPSPFFLERKDAIKVVATHLKFSRNSEFLLAFYQQMFSEHLVDARDSYGRLILWNLSNKQMVRDLSQFHPEFDAYSFPYVVVAQRTTVTSKVAETVKGQASSIQDSALGNKIQNLPLMSYCEQRDGSCYLGGEDGVIWVASSAFVSIERGEIWPKWKQNSVFATNNVAWGLQQESSSSIRHSPERQGTEVDVGSYSKIQSMVMSISALPPPDSVNYQLDASQMYNSVFNQKSAQEKILASEKTQNSGHSAKDIVASDKVSSQELNKEATSTPQQPKDQLRLFQNSARAIKATISLAKTENYQAQSQEINDIKKQFQLEDDQNSESVLEDAPALQKALAKAYAAHTSRITQCLSDGRQLFTVAYADECVLKWNIETYKNTMREQGKKKQARQQKQPTPMTQEVGNNLESKITISREKLANKLSQEYRLRSQIPKIFKSVQPQTQTAEKFSMQLACVLGRNSQVLGNLNYDLYDRIVFACGPNFVTLTCSEDPDSEEDTQRQLGQSIEIQSGSKQEVTVAEQEFLDFEDTCAFNNITSHAFSRDMMLLTVSTSGCFLYIFDYCSRCLLKKLYMQDLQHIQKVSFLDNQRLVLQGVNQTLATVLQVIEWQNQQKLFAYASMPTHFPINSVLVLWDSQDSFLTLGDGLTNWDVQEGSLNCHTLFAGELELLCGAEAEHSLILGDRSGNILFFLNNEDFQEIFRRKVQNEPLCLLCAQGKNFVATASANRVTLWVFSHSEGEEHLDFFAELLRVDVFDSSEEQLNTAQYVQSLDMHSSFILFGISTGEIYEIAKPSELPNNKLRQLQSGGISLAQGTNVAKLLRFSAMQLDDVVAVCFQDDGQLLYTLARSGLLRVIELNTFMQVCEVVLKQVAVNMYYLRGGRNAILIHFQSSIRFLATDKLILSPPILKLDSSDTKIVQVALSESHNFFSILCLTRDGLSKICVYESVRREDGWYRESRSFNVGKYVSHINFTRDEKFFCYCEEEGSQFYVFDLQNAWRAVEYNAKLPWSVIDEIVQNKTLINKIFPPNEIGQNSCKALLPFGDYYLLSDTVGTLRVYDKQLETCLLALCNQLCNIALISRTPDLTTVATYAQHDSSLFIWNCTPQTTFINAYTQESVGDEANASEDKPQEQLDDKRISQLGEEQLSEQHNQPTEGVMGRSLLPDEFMQPQSPLKSYNRL